MRTFLVAADAPWLRRLVRGALARSDDRFVEVDEGRSVRDLVAAGGIDLVVCDLQIGSMGGIAVTIDLRLEASAGRSPDVPVLLLLDREADRFLAQRADADAVLVKPLDPAVLLRTADALLADTDAVDTEDEVASGAGATDR